MPAIPRQIFVRALISFVALGASSFAVLGDSLGEKSSLFSKAIFGVAQSIHSDGSLLLRRIDPSTNQLQIMKLKQRNVLGFDASVIEAATSREMSCLILLEYKGVTFGDCGILVGRKGERQYTALIDMQRSGEPNLVNCSQFEREAFRVNGLEECVFDGEKE